MVTAQDCSVRPSGGPCWTPAGREVSRWGGLLGHLFNSYLLCWRASEAS